MRVRVCGYLSGWRRRKRSRKVFSVLLFRIFEREGDLGRFSFYMEK